MYLHNVISLFLIAKKSFWTKLISKILTTSIESLYCQECSNKSESDFISIFHIIVGGDDGRKKFRSFCKFILRSINVKKLNSYVIKNIHIDCDRETYELLNESIVKPTNDEI